jgi:hypothetical protein
MTAMTEQFTFSEDKARAIGETIGIDWATSRFDVAQFQKGLEVELEHGIRDRTRMSATMTRSRRERSRART